MNKNEKHIVSIYNFLIINENNIGEASEMRHWDCLVSIYLSSKDSFLLVSFDHVHTLLMLHLVAFFHES